MPWEIVQPDTKIDFIGKRRLAAMLSGGLLLASLAAVFVNGVKLGIDFAGGTEVPYAVTLSVRLTERDLQGNYGLPNSWQTDTNWTPSGFSRGATTTVAFNEGTLLISLVEPESRQLIWRASAETEVHTERSPERRRSRINSAVRDMFRGYPPRIR